MLSIHKVLKWVTFGFEAFLAIPLIGGAFILANGWTPLFFAGVLHLLSIVFLLADKQKLVIGNLIGLVGAMLGVIPILGWALHVFTAIVLFLESIYLSKKKNEQRVEYEADL